LNLITLGFVIGEAIRGPSNILAPLWPSSTFLVHVEATHWRKPRHPWTPQVRGSAPTPQPSNSSSTTKRRPTAVHHPCHTPSSCVGAWWTELVTTSQAYTSLLPAGNSVSTKKKKIKNRTRGKKEKKRKFQTLFSQNCSGGLSTLIESKPLRHGVPVGPLVEPPTFSAPRAGEVIRVRG
jgi:hypothetical protein